MSRKTETMHMDECFIDELMVHAQELAFIQMSGQHDIVGERVN